jgi:alkylhydroperoxidase/carboxymuconolactone decarboxylase family protein YurZ
MGHKRGIIKNLPWPDPRAVLKDGAIPAKYKILMTMVVDAIMAHPEGCFAIANRARAEGASEAEINEAVEVAYLFGGTPALVTATNALRSEG